MPDVNLPVAIPMDDYHEVQSIRDYLEPIFGKRVKVFEYVDDPKDFIGYYCAIVYEVGKRPTKKGQEELVRKVSC